MLSVGDDFAHGISEGGAGQTETVPPNVDIAYAVGTQLSCKQGAGGGITFAPGAGVTIESRGGLLNSNGESAVMSIVHDTATLWSLFGDLA